MKNPFRFSILPYFTVGAGILGLCLRLWLYSATDEKGLLPAAHPADTLLYILTALALAVLFLATRKVSDSGFRPGFRRIAETAGNLVGAVGLLLSALAGRTSILTLLTGAVGCMLLLLAAFFSLRKKAVSYLLCAAVTVALMVYTITQCRVWGAVPQLQHYVFPLLASIFLILTAYFRTTLEAGRDNRTHLAFFSQGALFLCCLAINSNPALYLCMACWAAMQLFPCYHATKEF